MSIKRRLEAVQRALLPSVEQRDMDRLLESLADTETPSIESRLAGALLAGVLTGEPEPPAPARRADLADHLVRQSADAGDDADARDDDREPEAVPPPPPSRRGWGQPSVTLPPVKPGVLPGRSSRFDFRRFFGNG